MSETLLDSWKQKDPYLLDVEGFQKFVEEKNVSAETQVGELAEALSLALKWSEHRPLYVTGDGKYVRLQVLDPASISLVDVSLPLEGLQFAGRMEGKGCEKVSKEDVVRVCPTSLQIIREGEVWAEFGIEESKRKDLLESVSETVAASEEIDVDKGKILLAFSFLKNFDAVSLSFEDRLVLESVSAEEDNVKARITVPARGETDGASAYASKELYELLKAADSGEVKLRFGLDTPLIVRGLFTSFAIAPRIERE